MSDGLTSAAEWVRAVCATKEDLGCWEWVRFSGIRIHRGFWRAYESVRRRLHESLEALGYYNGNCRDMPPLLFVGHSLG